MENKELNKNFKPKNPFINTFDFFISNNSLNMIFEDLVEILPTYFELEEKKEEIEYEINALSEITCSLLDRIQPKKIVLLDDYYETFIIIPENIDISAYDENEITLIGDLSHGIFTIRLSDGELIEIDGFGISPSERECIEINGYKIFRIGHPI